MRFLLILGLWNLKMFTYPPLFPQCTVASTFQSSSVDQGSSWSCRIQREIIVSTPIDKVFYLSPGCRKSFPLLSLALYQYQPVISPTTFESSANFMMLIVLWEAMQSYRKTVYSTSVDSACSTMVSSYLQFWCLMYCL